jgi:hypothetical protein
MFTTARLGLHDAEGGGADDKRSFQNAIQMLVDDGDMSVRPVHATGEALRALFGPRMGGNELAGVKDLHCTGGEAHIHSFTDEPIRHGVISPGDLDVIICVFRAMVNGVSTGW